MALPSLRHFRSEGIYTISSDPVEALIGEAWVPARYTDRGWATADGSMLLSAVEDWRYAIEEGQAAKASSSNRVRKSRKKAQA
jgi:hypothetical protein